MENVCRHTGISELRKKTMGIIFRHTWISEDIMIKGMKILEAIP